LRPQVDFQRYLGAKLSAGQPTSVALAGTNAQLMAVYSSALELLEPLLGGAAGAEAIAAEVVSAVYAAANATWAAGGDGAAPLSDAEALLAIYERAYAKAPAGAVAGLRIVDELRPLFRAVAEVRAALPWFMRDLKEADNAVSVCCATHSLPATLRPPPTLPLPPLPKTPIPPTPDCGPLQRGDPGHRGRGAQRGRHRHRV
jgi:hypothetical protein